MAQVPDRTDDLVFGGHHFTTPLNPEARVARVRCLWCRSSNIEPLSFARVGRRPQPSLAGTRCAGGRPSRSKPHTGSLRGGEPGLSQPLADQVESTGVKR